MTTKPITLIAAMLLSFVAFSQTDTTSDSNLGQLLENQVFKDNYENEAFELFDTLTVNINLLSNNNLLKLGDEYIVTVNFVNTLLKGILLKGFSNPCACISPEWSKTPIASGATGYLKLKYKATIIGPSQKLFTAIFYDVDGIKPAVKLPVVILSDTAIPQTAN
jgi:hypothetical protein